MSNNSYDGSLVFNTELDNEGFEKDSDKLLTAVDNLTKQVNTLGVEMKNAFAGVTSVLQNLAAASNNAATEAATGTAQATQAAQAAQKTAQTQAAAATQASRAHAQTAAATNAAATATKQFDKELAKLQKKIDVTKAGLADYYREIKEAKQSSYADLDSVTTEEQANAVLEVLAHTLDIIESKYAKKIAVLKQLEMQYNNVAAARDAANATSATGVTAAGVADTGAAAESAAPKVSFYSRCISALQPAMGRVRSAASGIVTVISKTGSGFGAIYKGVKKAVSAFKNFISGAKKTTAQSNRLVKSLTSLKTMLMSRIKRMFLSAIFDGVGDALKQLALFDTDFNKTMSNIKNSATQVTGNIAVAVSHLITVLEPVIMWVINLLNRALTTFSQFMAAFSGKTSFFIAKKGAENFADSAEDATKAQKELNAELYSFDELTRQQKKPEDEEKKSPYQFEKVDIGLPEGVWDWIKRLKDAWRNGEWYEVGYIIAEGLNAAMRVVDDWINNTLRPLGVTWASRVAQILNGLTDGLDWGLLGKTVADGLNAIADIYNTFMYTYDWGNLGRRLGSALNSLVTNVEWGNIGKAFAAKWQALVLFIHGIVNTVNWAELGKSIGTGIYSWFTSINWPMLASALVTGLMGAVTALRNAIQAINWAEIGKILADSIMNMVTGIQWDEIGKFLSEAIKSLLRLCFELICNIDWFKVGNTIVHGVCEMIANIDFGTILAAIGALITGLVSGALDLLLGALSGLAGSLAEMFRSIGADAVAGLFRGISEGLVGLSSWLKEHLVDPIIESVRDLFDTHSPSRVFAAIGEDLVAGLDLGISENWEDVTETVGEGASEVEGEVSDKWEKLFDRTEKAWTAMAITTDKLFRKIESSIMDHTSASVKSADSNAASMVANTNQSWGQMNADTNSAFGRLSSNVMNAMTSLRSAMSGISWNGIGTNLVAGLNNGITSAWGRLEANVAKLSNQLTAKVNSTFKIHSPSRVFYAIGQYLDAGLEKGILDGKRGLLRTAANVATAITNGMTPGTPNVQMNVDGAVGSMQTIVSALGSLALTFQTIANALTSIGGFTLPNIAAGTVAPYRTKVAANAAPADTDDGMEAYLSGILRELQALARSMRTSGSAAKDIRIVIGGREVFQTVVDENNRAVQMTGASPLKG